MSYCKKVLKSAFLIVATLILTVIFVPFTASASADYMYLGGFPAGFVLNTTTVEVIGLCDVVTEKGTASPARDSGIAAGDIIDKINGEEVNKTSDINKIISKEYRKYVVRVIRGGEILDINVEPVKDVVSGNKRLGVLVKDSINGIGTVTYVTRDRKFASLGHPVTFPDNSLVEINGGTIFGSVIYDVKKGMRGTPGELRGAFESTIIGNAELNCSCGVYGRLSADYDLSNLTKISTATLDEVQIGAAEIYSTVHGRDMEKFKISIVKVEKFNKDNRNFVIKIDDKNLIDKTGGIVQGMSGSPIIQNGKLIGAVTHVFINDPTRGYGIGIDKMLSSY